MNNTEIFDDFDMVVALTQKTINDQLLHLTRLGVIDSSLILTRTVDPTTWTYNYQRLQSADQIPPGQGYLNVTELVPQVLISETGANIGFILEFREGTFGMEIGNVVRPVPFTAADKWQYGLMVRMDLATLASEDIKAHKGIPANVQDQLSKFCESMFTVNSLFMDFQSVDLLNFDPGKSNAGVTGDVGLQAMSEFMKFYLDALVRDGNPYILGYSIAPPKIMPEDSRLPEQLRPVGTTYTMYFDPVNQDLSNLNFCLVTAGGHQTVVTQPGNLDSNWITPAEQCDGKVIFGHGALIEPLILQPFFESYASAFFAAINGKINVNAGKSYAQAKSLNNGTYTFTVSDRSNGDDDNQYLNSFTVDVVNSADITTLKLAGQMSMYKKATEEPAEAWAQGSVNWSGTIGITTTIQDKVPVLVLTQSFQVDSSSQDSHTNKWADALAWIGKIIHGLLDFISGFALDFLGNIIDHALTLNTPGLPDVSTALGHMDSALRATIVLPAGDVFYFKSPATDADLNLGVPLTYKAQSSTPAPAATMDVAQEVLA